jgi:hypothetical protein
MAARKRPLDRKIRRVAIEVYPQDEDLWHRARKAALDARITLREWVMAQVSKGLDDAEPPA